MNINKSNLFARYYNWIYGEYPNDLCSFFWGSLFAVILFPICILGRLVDNYIGDDEPFKTGFVLWLVYLFFSVVGSYIVESSFGVKLELWQMFTLGFLSSVTLIAVIVGIISGIMAYSEYRRERREQKWVDQEHKPSFTENVSDFVGAVKGKYCTKINWK